MVKNNYTIVVLAGGKSSRMGQDKGLALLKGKPMISHLLDELSVLPFKILIVSNNKKYQDLGFDVVEDIVKEKGPLGGIYTAFENIDTQFAVILSCDIPFITKEWITFLIKNHRDEEVLISSDGQKTHPLVGIYSKGIKNIIKNKLLNNELKVMDLVHELKGEYLNFQSHITTNNVFDNINTIEELKERNYGM